MLSGLDEVNYQRGTAEKERKAALGFKISQANLTPLNQRSEVHACEMHVYEVYAHEMYGGVQQKG
jgi:hypothetical protein